MRKFTVTLEDDIHYAFVCYCAKHRKKMAEIVRQAIVQTIDEDEEETK